MAETVAHSPVPAKLMRSIDELIHGALTLAEPNSHLVIMSNGGFDGLHQKLVDQLRCHTLSLTTPFIHSMTGEHHGHTTYRDPGHDWRIRRSVWTSPVTVLIGR